LIGTYGTKRPSDVQPEDIEVVIVYTESRNADANQQITKLSGSEVIKPVYDIDQAGNNTIELLGGLYNLELPSNILSSKGIYGIYIRPVPIKIKIEDCGELSTLPDVKGLVFNVNTVPSNFIKKFTNGGLDGYRVEYLNNNGTKQSNLYRIITSSFLCEPIQQNNANSSQKSIRYSYNNNGTLLFCTITPNTAPSFKPTAVPFIGFKGQEIILTNTLFNPIYFELEMVNYDLESLALALYGEQSKSIEDGIYTIYDNNGNIYKQYDLYEIKDGSGNKLYEVRKERLEIDVTKSRNNIIG
jgi:hypothetical protein